MSYGFGKLNEYVDRAHAIAVSKGFWDDRTVFDPIDMLACAMLIVTEVAELAEEVRKVDFDINAWTEELADICIRVFDCAGAAGVNLEQAIIDKMAKNEDRPRKHGKVA